MRSVPLPHPTLPPTNRPYGGSAIKRPQCDFIHVNLYLPSYTKTQINKQKTKSEKNSEQKGSEKAYNTCERLQEAGGNF